MSKSEDIREWLRNNPGKHRGTDINSGLGLQGGARYLYSQALRTLVEREEVESEGRSKQRLYWWPGQG